MLDTKKLISKILSWISNRGYAYTGYGTAVSLNSYTSTSNSYECPADGLMQINCNYRSGSYVMGYVNGSMIIEAAATANAPMQGNTVMVLPVFKGQKLHIDRANNYCSASFIPYVGG